MLWSVWESSKILLTKSDFWCMLIDVPNGTNGEFETFLT